MLCMIMGQHPCLDKAQLLAASASATGCLCLAAQIFTLLQQHARCSLRCPALPDVGSLPAQHSNCHGLLSCHALSQQKELYTTSELAAC